MNILLKCIKDTQDGQKVFDYKTRTGYNIIRRAWNCYPHYFRLTRITDILDKFGFSGVKTLTTLTTGAMDYYVGIHDRIAIADYMRYRN
jgi:hypothetical protein